LIVFAAIVAGICQLTLLIYALLTRAAISVFCTLFVARCDTDLTFADLAFGAVSVLCTGDPRLTGSADTAVLTRTITVSFTGRTTETGQTFVTSRTFVVFGTGRAALITADFAQRTIAESLAGNITGFFQADTDFVGCVDLQTTVIVGTGALTPHAATKITTFVLWVATILVFAIVIGLAGVSFFAAAFRRNTDTGGKSGVGVFATQSAIAARRERVTGLTTEAARVAFVTLVAATTGSCFLTGITLFHTNILTTAITVDAGEARRTVVVVATTGESWGSIATVSIGYTVCTNGHLLGILYRTTGIALWTGLSAAAIKAADTTVDTNAEVQFTATIIIGDTSLTNLMIGGADRSKTAIVTNTFAVDDLALFAGVFGVEVTNPLAIVICDFALGGFTDIGLKIHARFRIFGVSKTKDVPHLVSQGCL
jgi:hypothetical protein